MKYISWYVIWNEDTEEFKTKQQALKRAKEIFNKGLNKEVFIQRCNDNNPDGYFANEETIFIKNL